jgi:hypothetical protein
MNAAAAPTLWERLTRLTALEDIQVKSLRECLRVVAPAMMVVLSWTYVVLANVNMVRPFPDPLLPYGLHQRPYRLRQNRSFLQKIP